MEKTFVEKVVAVVSALKAPKSQRNDFGKYNYRNCEDILEAVKPLLKEQGLLLFISDEIQFIGGRYYVKATATITDGVDLVQNSALAREAEQKKGMDESQITGSASSYARKYALNGLLCIDDTKDADSRPPAENDERAEIMAKISSLAKAKRVNGTNINTWIKNALHKQNSQECTISELHKVLDWLAKR